MSSTPPSLSLLTQWTTRQIILATLTVTAVIMAFFFLLRFPFVLLILFAAIIISIALQPIVKWLKRWHIPTIPAVLLIYALLVAAIAAFLVLGAPLLTQQIATVRQNANDGYVALRSSIIEGTSNLIIQRLASELPRTLPFTAVTNDTAVATDPPTADAISAVQQLSDWVSQGMRAILGILATFTLALYWLEESERIKQTFFISIPLRYRSDVREIVGQIEQKVSSYVLGQGLLCLIVGALSLVAYLLIGLPYALFLAIIAGIMEAVPMVGPFLGAVPALIVAFSISPLTAVWVGVASLLIQQIENTLLVPRIMDRAVGIRPLVSLMSLFAFGSLFGVAGALIAIPLAAVVQLLLDHYLFTPNTIEKAQAVGRDEASLLRYKTQDLVADIRQQVRRKEDVATAASDQIEDSIEAIALDLDSLLAQYSNINNGNEANSKQSDPPQAGILP